MGSRADFYIGFGETAEWLGSVAWDGYEWEEKDCDLTGSKTPDEFRAAVVGIKEERRDFTSPSDGWPWPWDDSCLTDYAYCFEDGKTQGYCFGCPITGSEDEPKRDGWLDMTVVKNVAFGARSGLIILGR